MSNQEKFMQSMLAAEARDVDPLFEACVEVLDLSQTQIEDLRLCLSRAWFVGARIACAKMFATAHGEELDPYSFETLLQPLVTESASLLNLPVPQTFQAFNYLQDATVAAIKSSETELTAMLVEQKHDISGEALDWLEKRRNDDA